MVHLPDDRVDLQLSEWFTTDNLAENVITVVSNVTLITSTAVIVNSTEGIIWYLYLIGGNDLMSEIG